jgi:flavin-binding protein dodecin
MPRRARRGGGEPARDAGYVGGRSLAGHATAYRDLEAAAAPGREAVVITGRTSPEIGSGASGPALPHVHAEIKALRRGGADDDDDAGHRASRHSSRRRARQPRKGDVMSVYSVVEIIGTSSTSWEEAAAEAVRTAGQHLRELRVAEVVEQDIHLDEGGAITYRTKLQISFKYAPEH